MPDILDCFTTDSAKRKFTKEPGLFKQGIKLTEDLHLSLSDQIEEIKHLPGMKKYNEKKNDYDVDLGWAGKYHVIVSSTPKAYRTETGKSKNENPFISSENNYKICLGTASELYNRCYQSDNILDCVKIINAILSCIHDLHGYRRWSTSTSVKRRLTR